MSICWAASAVLGTVPDVELKTLKAWPHEANILARSSEEACHSGQEKQ